LQSAHNKFQQQGIGLAAISYDTEAILKDFSARHGIEYPLIADPKSHIISRYGVLNTKATGLTKGMSQPGYIYVAPDGTVKEKFFETAYTDRYTASNLILKLFPELVEGSGREVAAPHIKLTLSQSDDVVGAGSRFTVAAKITLPPDTHVYAPGVKGYKAIQFTLEPSPDFRLLPLRYPQSKTLFLPAINESVPVYEGEFRLQQDVIVSSDEHFLASLTQSKKLTLNGTFFYQACDQEKCYLPQQTAVSWDVQVLPLDVKRSPEAIQHR
jgi:hypothetical protein